MSAEQPGGAEPGRDDETAAAWLARLAAQLGDAAMPPATQAALLRLARDVAHGAERKLAPLAAYVAGRHVERRTGEGATETDALGEVTEAAARLLGETPSTP
jgi:predicted nucleic acid-binding protein